MYLGTAQPSPDFNASTRPGPNLWSDSVLGLNDSSGKIVWAFQTTTHDIEDWDCSWSVMLANATIGGLTHETVLKGCKNGYVYALDAATGHPYWVFDPPNIKRLWKPINPLDNNLMHINWQNQPSKAPYLTNPFFGGAIESDPAYDPGSNTVFVATYNLVYKVSPCAVTGRTACAGYYAEGIDYNTVTTVPNTTNTTVWAIDVNSGQPKWSYFINNIGYRGGLTVSNGVVYVPRNDGLLDMLDATNGKLLNSKLIGSAMITQPAIAADSNGNVKLVMPASGAAQTGMLFGVEAGPLSGFIFALQVTPTSFQSITTSTTGQSGTTGIDPSTFYLVVALLIVFVASTGFLTLRRRKASV
jgi:alcohol dehydrogenase (cytochrome c)